MNAWLATIDYMYVVFKAQDFWREYVFKFASVVGGNPENWR
jgi:hypothetical protein